MIDLNAIAEQTKEDEQSVNDWCNEIYQSKFATFFSCQRELFKRLESKVRPISDGELEEILTSVPLQLFGAAEVLSELKISQEVVKMRNKQKFSEMKKASAETSQSRKAEEAELLMLENKLVELVYASIISRVNDEISFSKELIMSAKKIWDRRRESENANPIGTSLAPAPSIPEHKTFYEQTQLSKGQPIYGG